MTRQENSVDRVPDDFDGIKRLRLGKRKFSLRNATVLESSDGMLFTDYLDPTEEIDPVISGKDFDSTTARYIERSLQSNEDRFRNQIETVRLLRDISGARILDIGCGGGKFLQIARDLGAHVRGIELDDSRAFYARNIGGIDVVKRPIEDLFWEGERHAYDIVTLWDVIEHVNFPISTLKSACAMLKPGGFLVIDTPCKDAFYHRFGELTYAVSRGSFPTLLNVMYSSHPFGHKQIFSTAEIRNIMQNVGLEVRILRKFHELSFPVSFYLAKLTRSRTLARALTPFAKAVFHSVPIRNKMLVVAVAR